MIKHMINVLVSLLFCVWGMSSQANEDVTVKMLWETGMVDVFKDLDHSIFSCVETCFLNCGDLLVNDKATEACVEPCTDKCNADYTKMIASDISFIADLSKNFCLNKQSPDQMPKKEMLVEFAKGPCSPIMLIPGVMGTKLSVDINFNKLGTKQKELFNKCSSFWSHYKSASKEELDYSPIKDYTLWLPGIIKPFNLIRPLLSTYKGDCFSEFLTPKIDPKKHIENIVEPKEGIKIKTYKSFNGKEHGNCGSDALNLENNWVIKQLDKYFNNVMAGYRLMIEAIEHIGYVSGLTYQAVPYNWNISYRKNQVSKGFLKHLKNLNKVTGKRTTIIAHSMGNLNVLYNLSKMTQEQKDSLIFNYVALNPPYLGAPKVVQVMVGGNIEFYFNSHKFEIGLRFKDNFYQTSNQISLYEMMPKDFRSLYAATDQLKTDVLQRINKRINYEKNQNIPFEESGIPFWPKKTENCYAVKNSKCSIGLYNPEEEAIINFEGNPKSSYKLSQIQELLLRKNHTNTLTLEMYKKVSKNNEMAYYIPGVPVFLVFVNTIKTEKSFTFEKDFDQKIKNEEFPTYSFEETSGDGTVPTYSQIVPPLKWAFHYQNDPKNPKYKPVKFVEYCSQVKQNAPIYDKMGKDIESEFTENGYIGLKCKCDGKEHYNRCVHAKLPQNTFVINFVIDVLNAKQKVSDEALERVRNTSDELIKSLYDYCEQLNIEV